MNFEWLKQLPPQLVQFLEQMLPLPTVVMRYQDKVRKLEVEMLAFGNVLLEKDLVTKEELDKMTSKMLELKKDEYFHEDGVIVQDGKATKMQQENAQKLLQEAVDFRSEYDKLAEESQNVEKKSARSAPTGHGE